MAYNESKGRRKRGLKDSFAANQSFSGGGGDSGSSETNPLELAEVLDVVLSEDHPAYKSPGDLGKAKVRPVVSEFDRKEERLGYAQPINARISSYPVKYELVVTFSLSGILYYSTTANWKSNIVQNAAPNYSKNKVERSGDSSYQDAESGIPAGGGSSGSLQIPGLDSIPTDVNKLLHRPGDFVLEGRFGSSVKLGRDDDLQPYVWFRSGQREDTEDFEFEDINGTPASLLLTAPDTVLPLNEADSVFRPVTADDFDDHLYSADRSRTDFANEEGSGAQAFMNADRLVLNAKTQELLGFADLDINFVTNSNFTIDAKEEIRTFAALGQQHVTDRDYQILAEGNVLVGTTQDSEPVARGQQTHDRLVDLIKILLKETHPTPTGPSGPPIQQAEYQQVLKEVQQLVMSDKVYVDGTDETYDRN